MKDEVEIPNAPLVERKKKQHDKKVKKKVDLTQRFGRVNRRQQLRQMRLRDYEEEMYGY